MRYFCVWTGVFTLLGTLWGCSVTVVEEFGVLTESSSGPNWVPPSGNTPNSIGEMTVECTPPIVSSSPLLIMEAEAFSPGSYWAICPGPSCEDHQNATASAGGHLITKQALTAADPTSRITRTIHVPSTGTWHLWAKSARTGSGRQWGVTINGAPLPTIFGAGESWVNAGAITLLSPQLELGIFDAAPDAYWAYPDAFVLTTDGNFNPLLCPNLGQNASDCQPGNKPPEVRLRTSDAVTSGDTYKFDLRATDPDCDTLTFQWIQTAGPTVPVLDSISRNALIEIPQFPSDTELAFQVSVSDGKNPPVTRAISITALAKLPFPSSPRSCAQISHPYPCIEISQCGILSASNTYYLLTSNLSSSKTCLLTRDNVVIDLNGYAIRFDVGMSDQPSRVIANSGFEDSEIGASGTAISGWDLTGAPGAKIVSKWEMPLVGEKSLYVPANGEIISSWVELPVADRSYRGAIVQRRAGNGPVTISVERSLGSGATEVVCSRQVSDPLAAGKAAFCNFHGKPAGLYRVRASSSVNQYYDDAAIVPSLAAGIGAVNYFTQWQERPDFVCNLDDGTCNLPDEYASGNPTTQGGVIDIRNGSILGASRSMRSYGVLVKGARLITRNLSVEVSGVAAQTIAASSAWIFFSTLKANMPWVIDREALSETNATFGSGTVISDSQILGGQGAVSLTQASEGVVRRSRLLNAATVTNHYAISLASSENIRIEGNEFNCALSDSNCSSGGSGITFYRSRYSEVANNVFNVVSAPCSAEYVNGVFTTNAIRMTDYNASVGAPNGVMGNIVHNNVFNLKGVSYPQMSGCSPYANGIFYSVGAGDNIIASNQFNADNTSAQAATYAFYIGSSRNGGIWKDNILQANDTPIWYSSAYGPASNARLTGNRFLRTPSVSLTLPQILPAIRMGYCCGYEATNLVLRDNQFSDDFSGIQFTSNQAAPYSFEYQWTVSIDVLDAYGSPVSGATVKLSGASFQTLASTDTGGKAVLVVRDYSQSGTNHRQNTTVNQVPQNPYTLSIEKTGTLLHSEALEIRAPLSRIIRLP